MGKMHNPPHPGEILKDTVLGEGGGLSVTEFAARLGMTRVAVSRVVNGSAGISTDMAMRLEDALGTSAQMWLAMQAAYDLWQAKKHHRKIKRIQFRQVEHDNEDALTTCLSVISFLCGQAKLPAETSH
jgi:addiction module HigA family antidote